MSIIPLALVTFLVVALFAAWLGTVRNDWVYRQRTRILKESVWTGTGHDPYDRLASYEEMVRRFWIWDASKFIRGRGQ